MSRDLTDLVRLVDALEYMKAQSTALVISDVSEEIVDRYRLFIVLKNSPKTIITGAFSINGLYDMKRMLEVVVGGEKELARKPIAVFDTRAHKQIVEKDEMQARTSSLTLELDT